MEQLPPDSTRSSSSRRRRGRIGDGRQPGRGERAAALPGGAGAGPGPDRFHFQPVVQRANPGMPAFFEMLARMRLPDGQLLPAGAFMPAVEAGPLGRAIDRLALAAALKALAANPGLRLSVNMSPLTMGDEDWLAILAAAARGGSGVCGRLILEITEDDAMVDAGQTIDFMDHVRASGCAFALDDFGAGATGFKLLPRLPLRHRQDRRRLRPRRAAARDSQVLVECLPASPATSR